MKISTKGLYALRVMADLAEHRDEGMVPLKDVAARQELSEKYLEAIVKTLVQAELLTGVRGKGGGYRLTRAPEEYSLGAILRLTEGTLAPVECLAQDAEPCPKAGECRTLPVWQKLNALLSDFLDGVTLADLL